MHNLSFAVDNVFKIMLQIGMNKETLIKIGLSPEEAEVYLDLLEHGAESASVVASHTSVKRTYVYQVVKNLISRGLARELKEGKATKFEPSSPDVLLSLVEQKKSEANQAQILIENTLNELKTKYRAIESKPIIQSFEGINGLKRVYKDILEEKGDILLLRSIYDESKPDLAKTVSEQIKNQILRGIHVRTITPLVDSTQETFLKHDKERLVERHITHKQELSLPAQIIVYKTKVAIISLKKEIVATLIDNKDIADTFSVMFEFMWNHTEEEHTEITSKWINSNLE